MNKLTAIALISGAFFVAFFTLKGGEKMVAIYVALIMYKRRTIEQVPKHLQTAVLADLTALGLDGNGDPLQP